MRERFADILPKDPTGFKVWRNPKNGFVVISLHYTADPNKRDPLWKEETKRGMPEMDWQREYELSWQTHAGKPVYGSDFNESIHVHIRDREPVMGLPIIRGWDFGLTPACIFLQLEGKKVTVIDEIIETSMGAARFAPQVLSFSKMHFTGFKFFDFVDPAGFTKSESEETSCCDIMRRFKIAPQAGEMTYEKRLGSVLSLLTVLDKGRPCLMLNPRCKTLIAGFRGGYQYPEPASRRSVARMDRPLKNAFSHPHDALQYACSKIKAIQSEFNRPSIDIPMPEYALGGREW